MTSAPGSNTSPSDSPVSESPGPDSGASSKTRTPTDALIIDYDAGNLRSVQRACHQVGLKACISRDPDALAHAERVIFPGVGAAGPAMASLARSGMDRALLDYVASGRPVLGICLGLQISLDHSEENDQRTLGIVPGRVRRFRFNDPSLKVPHMGWNQLTQTRDHPVLKALAADDWFYFVHGYYAQPERDELVLATTDYEHDFACIIGKDNYVATQFHLEKSGRAGLRLLEAFMHWDGTC